VEIKDGAIASYLSAQDTPINPDLYYQKLTNIIPEAREFLNLIKLTIESVKLNESSKIFASKLGLEKGISGYIYHTIPMVIHPWLTYPEDYENGIKEIIKLGGDTDTTAAILGGIIGAKVGKKGIPKNWLNKLWLYPFNLTWLEKLGKKLTDVTINNQKQNYVLFPIYGLWLRNIIFFLIVIIHLVYGILL
jgi:ADP-ribosylglycohydrolase